MMLAFYLFQAVAHCIEEILISLQYGAVGFKGDNGLRLTDCINLTGIVCRPVLGSRNVRGVFHHFEGLAVHVHNRVVACLDPNILAAFANALVLTTEELSCLE